MTVNTREIKLEINGVLSEVLIFDKINKCVKQISIIRMIYEASYHTLDWSHDAKNQFYITGINYVLK